MRLFLVLVLFQCGCVSDAQTQPRWSIRASILLFPFSPLLTTECRLGNQLALQCESNFSSTHGVNLKLFSTRCFDSPYVFIGHAWVEDKRLREDGYSQLTYVGAGTAKIFSRNWHVDARFGLGPIWLDKIQIAAVAKVGIGRVIK